MELTEWAKILDFAGSPLAIVYLAIMIYRLRDQVKINNEKIISLGNEIHDNGFIKKDMVAALKSSADLEHKDIKDRIERLEEWRDRGGS